MNDDQHTTALHEQVEREPDQRERDETPRERETSALARHRDPSLTQDATGAAKKQRPGVEWVRPTDLIARHSAHAAGRGLDFQAELARRTRTPIGAGVRRLGDRARRLPPISAFGHSHAPQAQQVSRSGVSMS